MVRARSRGNKGQSRNRGGTRGPRIRKSVSKDLPVTVNKSEVTVVQSAAPPQDAVIQSALPDVVQPAAPEPPDLTQTQHPPPRPKTINIDTGNLCLFCFRECDIQLQPTSSDYVARKELCSRYMRLASRYLGLNLFARNGRSEQFEFIKNGWRCPDEGMFEITACDDCVTQMTSFCESYVEMEKIKLKLDLNVRSMAGVMKCAERLPLRFQRIDEHFADEGKAEEKEKFKIFRGQFMFKSLNNPPRVLVEKVDKHVKIRCSQELPGTSLSKIKVETSDENSLLTDSSFDLLLGNEVTIGVQSMQAVKRKSSKGRSYNDSSSLAVVKLDQEVSMQVVKMESLEVHDDVDMSLAVANLDEEESHVDLPAISYSSATHFDENRFLEEPQSMLMLMGTNEQMEISEDFLDDGGGGGGLPRRSKGEGLKLDVEVADVDGRLISLSLSINDLREVIKRIIHKIQEPRIKPFSEQAFKNLVQGEPLTVEIEDVGFEGRSISLLVSISILKDWIRKMMMESQVSKIKSLVNLSNLDSDAHIELSFD